MSKPIKLTHPFFLGFVIFCVALVTGLYFQRHFDVIPDLSSSFTFYFESDDDDKATKKPSTATVAVKIDESGWNQWQHIRHWPDEGAAWPPARLAHASCAVGDDMWVFGGMNGGTTPDTSPPKIFNDLWRYDEFHDRWSEVHVKEGSSPVPPPRLHHTLVPSKDGKKLILFGGFDGFITNPNHKAIDDGVWIFDIAERRWVNFNNRNSDTAAATDYPSLSSSASSSFLASLHRPSARASHEAIILNDNCMYIFGGLAKIGMDFTGADELWRYNLATHSWKKLGPSDAEKGKIGESWPHARQGFPMISLADGKSAYLFGGGCNAKGQHECNDEWILKVEADNVSWKRLKTTGAVPSPRRAPHADVNLREKIFLFGGLQLLAPATGKADVGLNGDNDDLAPKQPILPVPQIFDDFYTLDLGTLVWTKIEEGTYGKGTRPPPTFGHTVCKIRDKIVLFGGRTTTMASPGTSDVWEYWFTD